MRNAHLPQPRAFKITVTQHVINTAVACNGRRCMVSDAVLATVSALGLPISWTRADIRHIRISLKDWGVKWHYTTPLKVVNLIQAFDDEEKRRTLREFSFWLKPEHATVHKGGWQARRKPTASRKGHHYKATGTHRPAYERVACICLYNPFIPPTGDSHEV